MNSRSPTNTVLKNTVHFSGVGDVTDEERNAILEEAAMVCQRFAWWWDDQNSREGTKACNSLAHQIRSMKR